ncbi:iron complex transport system substrate-binding protein [Fodinibius roseus]|uniref:Iron complex transport system substrate-binding protein n=1 Tax=Fodinibius roseus TaxID=1194090 RepID=A0A1M4T381_9BACT|nr:iron complex transport system substrate-binding protein [Fodinibius roseus]
MSTALLAAGCQSSASKEQPNVPEADAEIVDFTHKAEADYAEGFHISYHDNYKLLEIINPFQDRVDTLRYSLVPRGIADQVNVKNTREIPIPVRTLVATSTTHVALTDMLNANETITGMVGADYIYTPEVRRRIEEGIITGFPEGELNKEKVLALDPDLLMISGGQSSQFDNYRVLMDSGIDLLVNSEWLETTPLGKAEWVKVMAALLNKEKLANEKFDAVARRYNHLKAAVDTVEDKPTTINNMPYKGAWFVPGGESFTARFLRDAGADYPWYDSGETGGLRKAFEVVYRQGLEADVWLHPGTAKTKEDILAKDERFRDFKSFRTGKIYHNYRRSTPSGANDFWESGVVRPDLVLADLVKIFHPEIAGNHNFYYYGNVE